MVVKMKKNMTNWINELKTAKIKKAMPVLSFPCITLMDITVKELISDSNVQAQGMKMIAEKCDTAASVSMMDLSVEAEAFGSAISVPDDEVPTVVGRIIESPEDAEALAVPNVGAGRTALYVSAIKKAAEEITDRPVFAGVIGPFSLAGRLMDMTEIMVNCYVEPEMVHTTLQKTTDFIIKYIKAFKEAGANGVVIAEPAAGLLSPELNKDFSVPYVKRIVEAVTDDSFILIYHNCGNTIPLIDDILSIGANAYHFGNAIDMSELAKLIPSDVVFMGNVDPAGEFRNGTVESITAATKKVLDACARYSNFVPSSGCDIPPLAKWENINAFFKTVEEFYKTTD